MPERPKRRSVSGVSRRVSPLKRDKRNAGDAMTDPGVRVNALRAIVNKVKKFTFADKINKCCE